MSDDTCNADRACWGEAALLGFQQSLSIHDILLQYATEKTGHMRLYDEITAVGGDCLSDMLHALAEQQNVYIGHNTHHVCPSVLDLAEFDQFAQALYTYLDENKTDEETLQPFEDWVKGAKQCFVDEQLEEGDS